MQNATPKYDEAVEDLKEQPLVAGHRFGEHGEIEMVVAACRRRNADKNPVQEEAHRRFLQPQPRMADGTGDDVGQDEDAEARDADAAQNHQQVFERIERAPFQMALLLQDQPVKAHWSVPNSAGRAGSRRAPRLGGQLFHVADQCENLYRIWPEIRRELVLDRLADLREAALVDVLDNLDAHLFELCQCFLLELERDGRLVLADFIGCGLHPFLLLVGQAAPGLVAHETARHCSPRAR